MSVRSLLLALLASLALPVWAVPAALVDAVVTPAWIERGGREQPLAVGMEVRNGDRIRTGDGARAYLKLAEGSVVKIGENASLSFFSRSLKPKQFFRGALDIAVGAFRFTTDALDKARERDVSVRVGTATIGIRGTDVWGKSDKERDLVMLIEGAIEVRRGGETVEMAEPLTAFVAPRSATPPGLEKVSQEQLESRARETEIEEGAGAARKGGRWNLLIGRAGTEREALDLYDIVRGEGFPARTRPLATEGGGWNYEVLLDNYPSRTEADQAALRLKARTGLEAQAIRQR
jgi:hypothetical protein